MSKTSAKDLKALKEKMKNSDPKAFAEISKRNTIIENIITNILSIIKTVFLFRGEI